MPKDRNVRAPVTGKVIEILVDPGSSVELDEPVVVLEALKTKLSIMAPADGTVSEYFVRVGDDVEAEAVLATIEDGR